MKGLLVVVEGPNGCGKTTAIDEIMRNFKHLQVPVVRYKFPNREGVLGHRIDQFLKGEITISSAYDRLSMFASDRHRAQKNIEADIARGCIVICDRYIYSAIAYHIPRTVIDDRIIDNYIKVIGHFDCEMPTPDIVYQIDGDHLSKRGSSREVFHYTHKRAEQLQHMLHRVIVLSAVAHDTVRNKDGQLAATVSYIINDIFRRVQTRK